MAITTEKRLFALEEELKALKAMYKISGGTMNLYESVSPEFSIGPDDVSLSTIIRFTPNYSDVQHLIVPSLYYEFIDDEGNKYNLSNYAVMTSSGANYLTISVPTFEGTIQLKIISNIPGTFTRI